MEEQANYGKRVFKDKIITKTDLLKKIDKEMEKLDEADGEGFVWWNRFKEFIENNV
jgi:hypothetical protein